MLQSSSCWQVQGPTTLVWAQWETTAEVEEEDATHWQRKGPTGCCRGKESIPLMTYVLDVWGGTLKSNSTVYCVLLLWREILVLRKWIMMKSRRQLEGPHWLMEQRYRCVLNYLCSSHFMMGCKDVLHKTSRDVGMVRCVSQTHLCLHGKRN